MKINIPKERRAKFNQELVPIVFLSTIQIWWCFNFPAFIRLGNPWNTILGVILSIIGTLLYIYIFTFADTYTPFFKLEYLDDAPHGHILKNIQRIALIAIFHITTFFTWYKDMYHMSNVYYAFSYIYCFIGFFLIARAANRWPDPKEY